MSDLSIPGNQYDPNSWLAQMKRARPDLFPGSTVPLAQPMGAGLNIQPLGSPPPVQGAPQNVNPLTNISPMPQAPNLSADQAALGQLTHKQAITAVNPLEIQGVENASRLAGYKAQQSAMPQFDPNSPAYHWNAVQPQGLGAPQPTPMPTRPAPGRDPQSSLLAMIGGLVDPRGAGAYNAQPLLAGTAVANQQYEDNLRRYQEILGQNTQQYEAQRANAEQANRYGLVNQQEQHSGDVASLADQQRLGLLGAGLAGNIGAGQSLAGSLPGLASRTTAAAGLGADVGNIERGIGAQMKSYELGLNAWEKTLSPAARLQSMTERMYAENLMNQLKQKTILEKDTADNTTRENVGEGHDTARVTVGAGNNATSRANAAGVQTGQNSRQDKQIQADGASAGAEPTANMLKDPNVKMAQDDYNAKLEQFNMLQRQQARIPVPSMQSMLFLKQATEALHGARDYRDAQVIAWNKAHTATPGTSGTTSRPAAGASRPGAPVGGGRAADPFGLLR